MVDDSEEWIDLNTFFDALEAGKACGYLEQAAIPFAVEDLGQRRQGVDRFEGPAIWLDVRVRKEDFERAKECLRSSMHLFPLQEEGLEEYQAIDDEDVFAEAAACEQQVDAEAVRDALLAENIWSKISVIADDADPTALTYAVEVHGRDVEKAVAVVDRWGETL